MSRVLIVLLCVTPLLVIPQPATAAGPLPPAAAWIPSDAIFTVEVSNPKALLDLAFHPAMVAKVQAVPAYRQAVSTEGAKQFFGMVKFLEAALGSDWRTVLDKVSGGGITLAACPDNVALLIVDAKDGKALNQLHEMFLGFARSEAGKQGEAGRVRSDEHQGVTTWTFDGNEAHAVIGNRLIWANKSEGLRKMLDVRTDGCRSLGELPAYRAAKEAAVKATEGNGIAFGFVNVGILKHVPPIAEALAGSENPMAALLFAGVTESLRNSTWLALGLGVRGDVLSLLATVDGKVNDDSKSRIFAFPPKKGEGALPNLDVPGRIAAMSVWRDLRAFYAAKDNLFPERTSELIFFENMMGIFFSGRDLTEDVLGQTYPEVRVVVAEQEFEDAAPQLQLPSFAAVFRLRDPEKFGLVAEEAWQKAIGLVNFTRGQQAQAGMLIRQPTYKSLSYTMAYFLPGEDGKLETHHNFRPSLAVVGDSLVLSSTDALTEKLIDALKKEGDRTPKRLSGTHSRVELDAGEVAAILAANRDHLIRQNVVEKGHSEEQAATEIDMMLLIAKNLGRMRLSFQGPPEMTRALLEWKLDLE